MQFEPPSSWEKGSAESRPVISGAIGFGARRARSSAAAIPPGCSTRSAAGCADRSRVGSHIGMTCTVGRAGLGATGWMPRGGRGDGGLARKPSGQTPARTLQGVGRGRSSTGLGPLRRTWTTSTTLLLPPPAPLFRGVLSTRRRSLCVGCAPDSSGRGKTRSASDMAFHGCARSPCGTAGSDVVRPGAWAPSACHGHSHGAAPSIGRPARAANAAVPRGFWRAGRAVVRAEPGSGHGRARQVETAGETLSRRWDSAGDP